MRHVFILVVGLSVSSTFCIAQTVSSLSIVPAQPATTIGGSTQLSVTAAYADGSSSTATGGVLWRSSDARVVSVSASGVATGNASGIVSISASYRGKTASTAITSTAGDIQWSGPLTITRAGTYSGNWRSTDPSVPAITIATSAAVTIQNSYVMGPNDLIVNPYWGNQVTVKNVVGLGVNPNVAGQPAGAFVNVQNPALLDVENCYFENVRYGVLIRGYAGSRDGTQTVTIVGNRGRNMLGTESNGNNGTLAGEDYWQWAHAIQLNDVYAVPGIQIAWNEIVNYPYQSLVNENVSLYDSSGTSSSPLQFRDNYIQGAYAYDPAVDAFNGGGFATDGWSGEPMERASAFINIFNNQIVDTVGMGIEIGSGHNNSAYNNRVLSSGLLPDGTQIPAQNVGIAIFDVYGNIAGGSMYSNDMHDNTVGWMCWDARCAWDGYRNDEYFPTNGGDYATNQTIAADPITLQAQDSEYSAWQAKVSANGVVVGPGGNGNAPPVAVGSGNAGGSNGTISKGVWYTVTNTNSTLCVEAGGSGSADGTIVDQSSCSVGQGNQDWEFQPTSGGYYRVVNRNALSQTGGNVVWDVSGGNWGLADGVKIQLWTYVGGANQQWMPVAVDNGAYKFVARRSGKCLDVPGASSAAGLQMQQYDCNGTAAQSFTLQPN